MPSSRVIIALFPERIDVVAMHRGRASAAGRLAADLGAEAGDWPRRLVRCATSLRGLLNEVAPDAERAEVLYLSPTQAVDQVSLPARSAADAEAAAVLGATESLGCAPASAVVRVMIAGRDAGRTEATRRMHLVVAADRDEVLSAIAELVEEIGLKFDTITPLDAAIMAAVLGAPLDDDGAVRGRLHIGESSSFFTVQSAGTLCFGRRIALGVRHLVSSLKGPLPASAGRDALQLDEQVALQALFTSGLQRSGAAPPRSDGPTAEQLLPLMQPVLQRLVVELRQSLRFGATDEQRGQLSMTLMGPGSHIPGIEELLGSELRVPIVGQETAPRFDFDDPASPGGELLLAGGDPSILHRLNLVPRGISAGRKVASLRRWLWSGAALALAAVAFDAVRYESRLTDARQQAQSLALRSSGIEILRTTSARLSSAMSAMNELEVSVNKETGLCPDVAALMHELGRLTPARVRLASIALTRAGDRTEGVLAGSTAQDPRAESQGGLDGYVNALRGSPLLGEVGLRNVQFTTIDGAPAQQFEVTFSAIAAPGDSLRALAVAAGEATP